MNESLIKSDVFFFVATLGFILLTILLAIGLLYILSILKTIREISKTAKDGAETIVEGIHEAKDSIKKDWLTSSFFTQIFKKLYKRHKR